MRCHPKAGGLPQRPVGKPLFGRAMTRLVAGEDVVVMQVTDPQCRGNTRPRYSRGMMRRPRARWLMERRISRFSARKDLLERGRRDKDAAPERTVVGHDQQGAHRNRGREDE